MQRFDAIYARQSADRADSISIESQVEFCLYETRGGPYQIYTDRGYSGKNTERPEFQNMLRDIEEGKIQRVICYKLDRCSRSILDFTSLMEFFREHNVEFISCTEKFDTASPMGRAMLNICIVFAQLERETIQLRVFDAYHARCKHGFYMGGRVPFGYRLQPYKIQGKSTSCYVPEPEEAMLLQKIYALYAMPDYSLSDVCRRLKEEKLINPRRKDGIWVRSHVGRLLKNPIYVRADLAVYYHLKESKILIQNPPEDFIGVNGCYLYTDKTDSKQIAVLAPHEGIVSSQVWLACRRKGRGKTEFAHKGIKHSWLSGRIKCGICGYAMLVRKSGNRVCFRCSMSAEDKTRCPGVGSPLLTYVENGIIPELSQTLCMLAEHLNESLEPCDIGQSKIHMQIAALEAEADAMIQKLPEASPSIYAHIRNRIDEIDAEIEECVQRLHKCQKQRINSNRVLCYEPKWENLSQRAKMRIAQLLIKRVAVFPDKICVEWVL